MVFWRGDGHGAIQPVVFCGIQTRRDLSAVCRLCGQPGVDTGRRQWLGQGAALAQINPDVEHCHHGRLFAVCRDDAVFCPLPAEYQEVHSQGRCGAVIYRGLLSALPDRSVDLSRKHYQAGDTADHCVDAAGAGPGGFLCRSA